MSSLTRSENKILRGVDRSWAAGHQPERGLVPDTSSSSMFANILNFANTALPVAGSTIGSGTTKYTILNGLALQNRCDSAPFGVSQPGNIDLSSGYVAANSSYRCGTDHGRQFMLATPSETTTGVLVGTFTVGANATALVEYIGSRYHSRGEFAPYQFSTTSNALTHSPVNGQYYVDMKALYGANDFDPTKPIAYRLRLWDWGYRLLGQTSTNHRPASGLEGVWGEYDYKVSLSHGKAEAYSGMIDGHADANKLVALLASGKYIPFLLPGQTQSAEAMALVEETKTRGHLFGGKTQVDDSMPASAAR